MTTETRVLGMLLDEKTRQIIFLCREIQRLRGLVKDVEWEGCVGRDSDPACPWCGAEKGLEEHGRECPAFVDVGVLRDAAADALAKAETDSADMARRLLRGEEP